MVVDPPYIHEDNAIVVGYQQARKSNMSFHNQFESVTCTARLVKTHRLSVKYHNIPNWVYCKECDRMIKVVS